MFMDYSCDFTSNSTKDFFNYPEDLRSRAKGASGWGQHTLRGARVTVPLQRKRITFTKAQLGDLETAFSLTQYPDASLKQTLSSITGLPESRIQVWFQNRRARYFRNKKQLQNLTCPRLPEAPKNPSLKRPAPHTSPNLPSTYHSPNLPTEFPSPNHPSPNLPSTNLPSTYPSPKLPSVYPSPNLPSLNLPSTCPSSNLPPTCPSPNLSSTYPSHNVPCAYSAPDIPSVTLLPYIPQPFTATLSVARGSVSAPECMLLTAPAAAMTPARPGAPAECKSLGGWRSGEWSVLQCENKEQRGDMTDWEATFYQTCQRDTHTPEQREGRGVYRVKEEDYTHLTTPTQTLPLHYPRHGALATEELDILPEFSGHVYEDFGLPDLEVSAAFIDYLLHD